MGRHVKPGNGDGPTGSREAYLERLVINVSHDCNLRCTYCYADTGAYGAPRMKLSNPIGEKIVDDFYARFAHIGMIQFFGGEPFLNHAGIDYLCDYITRVCARNDTPVPAFTVVTNGTILNEAVIDTINRHGITLTVSLDGLAPVNDAQRVYANGSGSYARVIENIAILKARTGGPGQIEGTFTAQHLESGFSLSEFMHFMATELDVHFLHMPWIVGDGYGGTGIAPTDANVDRVIAIYQNAVSASLQSLETRGLDDTILISNIEDLLQPAVSNGGNGGGGGGCGQICPAGSGTLSAGADGKIYPCFMFTNNEAFELGRVGEGGGADFGGRRSAFTRKLEIPDGESAAGFETGAACAGQNYDLNGRIDAMAPANKRIQTALDTYLRAEVAKLQADGERWEWILTKYRLTQLDRELARGEAARATPDRIEPAGIEVPAASLAGD